MALIIFVITYVFLAGVRVPGLPVGRIGAAFIGATAMICLGVVAPPDVVRAVDVDTIVLLMGMMIIAELLTEAQFFNACAHWILQRARTPHTLLLGIIVVSAVLSAILVNDTVCLMLTPLVLAMIDRAQLHPLPYLLGLCMAANAGSSATFTGNPQNMLIGMSSHIPYATFVLHMLVPATLATASVYLLLRWFFRTQLGNAAIVAHGTAPAVNRLMLLKGLFILGCVVIAFFTGAPMSWSALAGGAAVIAVLGADPRPLLERVDVLLLLFFVCLFIVVYGFNQSEVARSLQTMVSSWWSTSSLSAIAAFTFVTLIGSNLLSNVPFVMIARDWVSSTTNPVLFWEVLALASTLAGNLTIIGSVANVIVFEAARSKLSVSFWAYFRVGLPVTLISLVVSVGALVAGHLVLAR